MNTDKGVVYVVYGHKAQEACRKSIASLRRHNPLTSVAVVGDDVQVKGVVQVAFQQHRQYNPMQQSRHAKTNLDQLTPFKSTVYLDADTIVYQPLDTMFDALICYEWLATISTQQGKNWIKHAAEDERVQTLMEIGYTPVQLQGGVFGFRRTNNVRAFFAEWRRQWALYADVDQAALMRALHECPMSIWYLGLPFNGGAVIGHLFGTARSYDNAPQQKIYG